MHILWNEEKNTWLKHNRGISFEQIEEAIITGGLIKITSHPNQQQYPQQKIMHVLMNSYVYVVPFVISYDGSYYLKTAYPSRKITKDYKQKGMI